VRDKEVRMAEVEYLEGPGGRRLAYAFTPGRGPVIVFLSGYKSDMQGTKAVHLEAWAEAQGRAFLRLDYSGHGASGGVFEEGAIGDWAADAETVVRAVCTGPVVLVGSSMGGWIGCLLARRMSRASSASPRRRISPRTASGPVSTPRSGRGSWTTARSSCRRITAIPTSSPGG